MFSLIHFIAEKTPPNGPSPFSKSSILAIFSELRNLILLFEIIKDFIKNINFNESDLFFIKSNNTRHNIFGLWSIKLFDRLERDLKDGERKVELWANNVGVKVINMEFPNKDPFFNINTKEDLEKAKEILK